MMWSAFLLGLLGSLHCLAMCGPLVLTLNSRKEQTVLDKALYNSGRIFTYSGLGVIAGVLGSSVEFMVGQQYLSIISGLLLISGLTISWVGSRNSYQPLSRLLVAVKIKMSSILSAGARHQWWFGVYNGLLPCGLTYVALAAAVSTGSIKEAVLYMMLFGIGTSPMMWVIVSGFQKLRLKRTFGNKLVTGFTWMLAVLLIIRGLGLGVPYLSPDPNHRHDTHVSKEY